MAKVYTVINEKGGVGKTAHVCHSAFRAAELGLKVLVADLDTQGNASQFLTGDMDIKRRPGGAENLFNGDLDDLPVTPGMMEGISVLHGHDGLEVLDGDRARVLEHASQLRDAIKALPYDVVIFDTPPNIGPRHVAPLFWSDLAVVIIQPHVSALSGLRDIIETIDGVRAVNYELETRLAINMFKKASSSHRRIIQQVEEQFGQYIVGELADRVAVADALAEFKPVWRYSKDKALNTCWREYADNVLNAVA